MKVERGEKSEAVQAAESKRAEFKKALYEQAAKASPPRPGPGKAAGTRVQPTGRPGTAAQAARATTARTVGARIQSEQQAVRRADQATTVDRLKLARQSHESEATRLIEVRHEPATVRREPAEDRFRTLLAQELSSGHPSPRADVLHSDGGTGAKGTTPDAASSPLAGVDTKPANQSSAAQAKLAEVQALVEKVELFLKSNRPGLTLSLAEGFAAQVRIERTGPGQVAIHIQGRNGPLGAAELIRVRQQLGESGIAVSALTEFQG